MKKILYTLIAIVAFTFVCSNLNAQGVNVYFTKLNNPSAGTLTGKVYCSKAATVTFELITAKNSSQSYGSATYQVINYNNMKSCYVSSPTPVVYTMTVSLPQGESNVEIGVTQWATATMRVKTVNGVSYSTSPIVYSGQ